MKYTSFNDLHLLNEFNGEEDILLDMICMFQNGLSDLLNPLRESIIVHDAVKLKIVAHTIKGVLGNFYAEEGKKIAYELEKRGEHSVFDDTLILLNRLENQLQLILFELSKLKSTLVSKV